MHTPLNDFPLWTALVTPLKEDLSVDIESLLALLKRQEAAKNGIVLFGSTGEGISLDEEEKKQILREAHSLKLKVPLMIGVGGLNLPHTLRWLEYCEKLEVDCFQLVNAPYVKAGPKGQAAWFKTLMDAVTKPCMLYNIPSRTASALSLEALKQLQDHPNLWAMKEGSGSVHDFHAYRQAVPEVRLYSGDDGMIPYFAAAGAVGLISIASNVWPDATRRYVEACLAGKMEGVMPLWHHASQAFFVTSNPVPVKALLHNKGWITTPYLKPPLSHMDMPSLEPLLMFDRQLNVR